MGETVLYEPTGNIGIIKLNRSQVLNALNDQLTEDFIMARAEVKL